MAEKFNQSNWDKNNLSTVIAKYRKDFVLEFKDACKALGISQSDVIREAMQQTIDKARKVY